MLVLTSSRRTIGAFVFSESSPQMKPHRVGLLAVSSFMFLSALATAEEWNQFRGATGSGLAEGEYPSTWSMDAGIRWSVELPGRANSSPAVTSRRVDLTTQTDDGGLWVLSYERSSGKLLRQTRVGQGELKAAGAPELWAHRHNAATPSPIASEEHIWAYFGSGLLVCLEASSGQIVWKRDLAAELGEYDITFGMASSPRLYGGQLFIACMTKGNSYLLALDPQTGLEKWRTERRYAVPDDHPDAYASPIIQERSPGAEVVLAGAGHLDSYALENGQRLWSQQVLMIDSPYGRVIASPIAAGELIIGTSGNPAGGGKGHVVAINREREVWRWNRSTPDSSTPVVVGDLLFAVSDAGIATCLNVQDGRQLWQKRLGGGPYNASLVSAGGLVYFLGIDGVCTVIRADAEGTIVARNALPGTFYATPALADGQIYLRAYERLFAIGD